MSEELDPNTMPEVDAGEPVDEEPEGWELLEKHEELLERLKELEADVDSSIGQLRRQVDDLLRRVMDLESNKSD